MIQFSFTYEEITDESANQGDFSDNGYYQIGGWKYSINDEDIRKDILANPDDYHYTFPEYRLRDILPQAENLGISEDNGSWLSSVDPDINYHTGVQTFYSLHFSNITKSTYNRIKRIMKIR